VFLINHKKYVKKKKNYVMKLKMEPQKIFAQMLKFLKLIKHVLLIRKRIPAMKLM